LLIGIGIKMVIDKLFKRGKYSAEKLSADPNISLRGITDSDIEQLSKWLEKEHVAKWFENPHSWLQEIEGRHGEFSYIKHFIIEYQGQPIGFCQYYDCYFGQEKEDWYTVENSGEVFSIDYLIGDTYFLGKGIGRDLVGLLEEEIIKSGGEKLIVKPDKENAASNNLLKSKGYTHNGEYYEKILK
jgi:RimJ/RimL family protein N-acetyltransferase